MSVNTAMLSTGSGEWQTPRRVFQKLDDEFHFRLDAAATAANALCEYFYTAEDSAFDHDWAAELIDGIPGKLTGLSVPASNAVFLNPPYQLCKEFMKKALEESRKGITVVCLVAARMDTQWWHRYAMEADEIRILEGRVQFTHPDKPQANSSTFPSAVVIFRNHRNRPLFTVSKL